MQLAHLAISAALGGLFAWERNAFLQSMFSRPLVASALLGAALGDARTGLYVGLPLELFFLGKASLGASMPAHETLAATCATSAAIAFSQGRPGAPAQWMLAILLCLPMAPLGRQMERWLESFFDARAQKAIDDVQAGKFHAAMRQHVWAMAAPWLSFSTLTLLCTLFAQLLAPHLQPFETLHVALGKSYPWVLTVTAAMAIHHTHAASAWRYALVGASLVGLLHISMGSLWPWPPV